MEHSAPQAHWKKNTVLFLASQTLSLFGSLLVQYAITWHITLNTQSGIMMTIAIICGFLPNFFLSPFAGVWADRYNRKYLIVLSDLMIAAATLALAVLFWLGYEEVWLLFAALVLRALGGAVQSPAVSAFLPQFVPPEQLTRVNAVNGTIQSVSSLIAPALSGALLTFADIEHIFFIDVGTALLAVTVLLLFVRVPAHAKALLRQTVGYFTDMRAGFSYIRGHAFVRVILVFNAAFFLLVSPLAFLTPLQVARSFGDDVWRLTATEMVFSVGMMLGGMLMVAWSGFPNRLHTMSLSNLIIGVGTVALGLVGNFWLYLLFMAVIGVAMPLFNTPFNVLLQRRVEGDYLGRVFGVFGMLASALMPLGMLLYGPLADVVRIEWMLTVTGVLMLVLCAFMRRNRVLVEAGRPDPPAAQGGELAEPAGN